MRKKVLSIMISGVLLTSFTPNIFAEPLTEEQQKNIDDNVENLTKAEKELREIQEKLTSVNTDMDIAKAEIDATGSNLDAKQKEIESTKIEIDSLQGELEQKSEALGDRLNSIYKSGGANSYMQMLLGSDSLSDFLGRVSAVNQIIGLDEKALDDVQSKNDQLVRRVEKLEKDKEDIKQLEIDNKKKVEELSKIEKDMSTLTEEYKKKYSSADIDLFESEKVLYAYWKDIIDNNKSSIGDVETSVTTLKSLKDKVKSDKSIKIIDELISKGETTVKSKKLAAAAGVDISEASGKAAELLGYAYQFLGRPYVWGAVGPSSFDCSGFTGYVFKHVGISLPRVTYDQQNCGVPVSRGNLQPGDLILTRISGRGPEHVGIYVGNGKMIHAANPAEGVKVGPMHDYGFARRIL